MPDTSMLPPFDAYQGREPYVFVSYSHADSQLVFPEIARLHGEGYRIWFDEGIDPGNEWPDEIADALTHSTIFMVFISPRSAASRNVRNEINFALNNDKPIIAIHLEETSLPSGLALRMGDIQAIFQYRMSQDFYWRKLLRTLTARVQAQTSESPTRSDSALDQLPGIGRREEQSGETLGTSEKLPQKTAARAIRKKAGSLPLAQDSLMGFKLPPSSLLNAGEAPQAVRGDELREAAKVIVEKCAQFDVRGQVVQINPGPIVTTYEFKPEAGVKYSRIIGLADDLCLAMRADSILIERMAGKSTVGIEVPNRERETIQLRDVLESETFAKSKSRLTLAMGKDLNGRIVTADLAAMPHLLTAGSPDSGISVAIKSIIMSLLFRNTPGQVRLILIDPKRVELAMFNGVPHLFTPIITEPKAAANALHSAVLEMERRLKLLAKYEVRNIDQYNKLFDSGAHIQTSAPEVEKPFPYLVIIVDELADLMMIPHANVEESITRLAQMARAVGIHLILATQRPAIDVITGMIKANFPSRISFRMATKADSRAILDSNGAEALLGRGDMLFLPPGSSRMMRLHAPYVNDKEIAAVVEFWKAQAAVVYADDFLNAP